MIGVELVKKKQATNDFSLMAFTAGYLGELEVTDQQKRP
jgi:hypothetical protein